MVGDGICDDSCNNDYFDHDWGDCCLPKIVDIKCQTCNCEEIDLRETFLSSNICMTPLIGDTICHDSCNTKEFDYDNFDCCYQAIHKDFCIDCECHLDGKVHESLSICYFFMVGDNFCHDQCNTIEHGFDNGDCCLPTVQVHPAFSCDICFCHANDQFHPEVLGACTTNNIGDGFCTDACNTLAFDYDFGDCCLPVILGTDCQDCFCHEDQTVHPQSIPYFQKLLKQIQSFSLPDLCNGFYEMKIGDGVCHPECNYQFTEFDGFDCCLDFIDDSLCSCGYLGDQSTCPWCQCKLDGLIHPTSKLFSLKISSLILNYQCALKRILEMENVKTNVTLEILTLTEVTVALNQFMTSIA